MVVVGQFVSNPRVQSCVDEQMSGMEHYMAALLRVLRWPHVRRQLEHYVDQDIATGGLTYQALFQVVRKAGAYQLIQAVCCPKKEQPTIHVDKNKKCPKLIPFWCTHGSNGRRWGTCNLCGISKKLPLLQTLIKLPVASELIEVMVWADGERQGEKKGKKNTQRE